MRAFEENERGAVAVVTAIFLVVLIGAAAMAFDTGRLTWTKRSLQNIADDAALDAVRAVGDRRTPGAEETDALAFAHSSLVRNNYDPTVQGHSLTVTLGIGTPATRTFVPLPAGGPMALANAVQVAVTETTSHVFAAGATNLAASSIAVQETNTTTNTTTTTTTSGIGGFSIGTFVGRVTSSSSPAVTTLNSVLSGTLGVNVNLDAASYNGLAASDVTVGALEQQLAALIGAGSPSQVLAATITLKDLFNATANALAADGSPDAVAATAALRTIALNLPTDQTLELSNVLRISTEDPGQAADADVNVLSLVKAAIAVSDYAHFASFTVPVDSAAVAAGVTSATLAMSVVEKPAIAVGPAVQDAAGNWVTRAHTAQVRMLLTLRVADGVVVNGTTYPITIPVYVEAGGGDGALTGANCATGNLTVHAVTEALHAYVGTVPAGAMTNVKDPVTVTKATLVEAGGLLKVFGYGDAALSGTTKDLTFAWGSPLGTTPPASQTVGASSLDVGDLLDAKLSVTTDPPVVAPPLPSTVATLVADKVDAALATIDSQLNALLTALGVAPAAGATVAGADVKSTSFSCATTVTGTNTTTSSVPGRRRLIG